VFVIHTSNPPPGHSIAVLRHAMTAAPTRHLHAVTIAAPAVLRLQLIRSA
jgi:hypothetical protein